jgi:hypothetical protein
MQASGAPKFATVRYCSLTITTHHMRVESVPDHESWQRLGAHVTRRRSELGLSQPEVVNRGGPSVSVQREIEKALKDRYTDRVIGPLERVLGWQAGSVQSILSGGEPTVVRSPQNAELTDESPWIRVGLPDAARDLTDAEREEIEANARAAALKAWREIRASRDS